mgnify:CR=1 FL=1
MSFMFKSSTPAKSQSQIDAEKLQAKSQREETYEKKNRLQALKRRRFGKQTLLSGSPSGLENKLGV